ncbi:unnamed protein product [Triticum turgidum subsp. durum]|uniref:Cytochrome P450 n=1 Tax=Triticum turgidum subsp. durum TaxID=4567 RepID=A0A9R0QYC7_TRITD|nr:unnamed protein product [Triticum turgidum subsp. durum]
MAELAPLSMLFLALLVVVPVLHFIRSSRRHEGSSRPRPPPSPWALPVIGHLHHVAGALPHRAMLGLSRRHGPLMLLRLCELRVVVASSADAAREIMKTQDLAFASRPMTPTGKALLGDSPGIVFTPYGDAWRQLRRICTLELFTSRRVRSFRPVREEEVGRLLRSVAVAVAPSPSPSLAVNLSERISAYVADSSVRAVIGSRFKDRGAFLRMLERRIKLAPAQCLPDLFPSSRLAMLVSRMPREMKRERREMRDFIDAIIQEHQENSTAGAGADDDDFLDVLLRIQREGKLDPPLTTDDIKAVIVDIFIASSETSATALQWAMAELMRNPRVMRKAQEEVRRALDGPRAGSSASTCRWGPEEFSPERFEGGGVDFKGTDFEYIPFGAGRRMCPGMAFGLANMELALASLLYHFDWELPDGTGPGELDMAELLGLTTRRRSDLLLVPAISMPLPKQNLNAPSENSFDIKP